MATRLSAAAPLGYYVHHHGTGHMRQALAICAHIKRHVIMFSSLERPRDLPRHITYVRLQSDVVANHEATSPGVFHYTPYDPAIFQRNQQLIDAWQTYDIQELYVDVSVEVTALAKLYGLTVGSAAIPGHRTDQAHRYGYDTADYLVAYSTPSFDVPNNRQTQTPLSYTGGIARFQKHSPKPLQTTVPKVVAVTMSPQSEQNMSAGIIACADRFPEISWHVIGRDMTIKRPNITAYGVIENPAALYEKADVIIGSGGFNTVMEASAAGKPFLCIPEPRPYDEQLVTAQSLERLSAAVYRPTFPDPADWPAICTRLSQIDLAAFSALVSDDAAAQAACIIEAAGRLS